MKTKSIFLLFLSILIVSCTGSHRRGTEQGDTLKLKYAEHLNLVKYDGYTVATLVDPWKKGRTLHTYVKSYLKVPLSELLSARRWSSQAYIAAFS